MCAGMAWHTRHIKKYHISLGKCEDIITSTPILNPTICVIFYGKCIFLENGSSKNNGEKKNKEEIYI